MYIFYSIHYPRAGKEAQLVESMHRFGELMKSRPGIVFVAPYPFKDPDRGILMGLSIWESEEAFQAALPVLTNARKDALSEELESRPPETYTLRSAA